MLLVQPRTKHQVGEKTVAQGVRLRGWPRKLLKNAVGRNPRYCLRAVWWVFPLWVTLVCVGAGVSMVGQSQPAPVAGTPETISPAPQVTPDGQQTGSIRGTVVDPSGAVIANVKISLAGQGLTANRETFSDADGQFFFSEVAPGPYQMSFIAAGFAPSQQSGTLHPGENYVVPQTALVVASANVALEVTESPAQIAEDEVKIEEKQRVLGVIPNFYVTYLPHAVPLTPRLKFQLAWKSILNPYTFGITGGIAGIEQAENAFSGYGQGTQGYAKRYGAAYGDLVTGTFIGGAILPTLFKQDPRYFYKGTGSKKSRLLYAIAMSVVCKGDNGHWQLDYSGIIGGLAAGGISNLYYPDQNRNGVTLTFENALIGIGGGAAGNILQEFVVRRFTPHAPPLDTGKP
jgi:hypothetical protein